MANGTKINPSTRKGEKNPPQRVWGEGSFGPPLPQPSESRVRKQNLVSKISENSYIQPIKSTYDKPSSTISWRRPVEVMTDAENKLGAATTEIGASVPDEPLHEHFRLKGVPKTLWPELASLVDHMILEQIKARTRPKWDERGKYADLKDLSSPAFLKRVYADEMGPDGTIKKELVRKIDRKLMALVEAYISGREEKKQDLGEANGLRLIAGPRSRPKRANFG